MKLKRETYLKQIRPYYESDIIKVITGVRRCGKSILLDTIREELVERGIEPDHIIYLNFEDMDLDYIADAADLNWRFCGPKRPVDVCSGPTEAERRPQNMSK